MTIQVQSYETIEAHRSKMNAVVTEEEDEEVHQQEMLLLLLLLQQQLPKQQYGITMIVVGSRKQ